MVSQYSRNETHFLHAKLTLKFIFVEFIFLFVQHKILCACGCVCVFSTCVVDVCVSVVCVCVHMCACVCLFVGALAPFLLCCHRTQASRAGWRSGVYVRAYTCEHVYARTPESVPAPIYIYTLKINRCGNYLLHCWHCFGFFVRVWGEGKIEGRVAGGKMRGGEGGGEGRTEGGGRGLCGLLSEDLF